MFVSPGPLDKERKRILDRSILGAYSLVLTYHLKGKLSHPNCVFIVEAFPHLLSTKNQEILKGQQRLMAIPI